MFGPNLKFLQKSSVSSSAEFAETDTDTDKSLKKIFLTWYWGTPANT